MFCPHCLDEYRDGFTRCSDCDVDLVSELADAGDAQDDELLQVVWNGGSEQTCVAICRKLKDACITYHVSQIPESRYIKMVVNWKYEINVLLSDYERARTIVESVGEPAIADTHEDQPVLELPPPV